MKKQILLLLFPLILIFAIACSEDSPTSSSTNLYKYTGYDSTWNKIITGKLWIDLSDSVEVKGTWVFNVVGDCKNIGPQTGKGTFYGTKDMLGTMTLNLNPGMIDNNVILNGTMRLPDRFDGGWSYVGFPGVINHGRFEAHR